MHALRASHPTPPYDLDTFSAPDVFIQIQSADGTVIQQLPDAMETTYLFGGNQTCTWRWWPGAAR